ncbi:MAG: adenylyl-sulfate kinase [Magnetococcales bacterium]|nr:adenylyl-sulfate kinase [Magnetococcales bacterium]
MILWIVGMSGAGKTTIGRQLHTQWKKQAPNTVLVDGDDMRAIFAHNHSPANYTVAGRRENAERIVELCLWLDRQGINVVCCILCIFDDILLKNRELFSNYFEIFVTAPMKILEQRDVKNIYKPARRGEMRNVVGIDIPFSPPKQPDMVIDNSTADLHMHAVADDILRQIDPKHTHEESQYSYAEGDRLTERNTYFYTPFAGASFIKAWKKNRQHLLAAEAASVPKPSPAAALDDGGWETKLLLEHLLATADQKNRLREKLLQKFEVTKRIFTAYNSDLRPIDGKAYHDLSLYLRWAEVLEAAYTNHSGKLPYLNALLKAMDILIAHHEQLSANLRGRLARLVQREYFHLAVVAARVEVTL